MLSSMLGRVLFAFVWLIIAAGLVLPLYPSDRAAPDVAAAESALLIADATAPGCEACPTAAGMGAGCNSACACWQPLPAAAASPTTCFSLTVYVIARPLPSATSSSPQPLPPKPPAI